MVRLVFIEYKGKLERIEVDVDKCFVGQVRSTQVQAIIANGQLIS